MWEAGFSISMHTHTAADKDRRGGEGGSRTRKSDPTRALMSSTYILPAGMRPSV